MKRTFVAAISLPLLLLPLLGVIQAPPDTPPRDDVRFDTVEVLVDPGQRALAAWQVEIHATSGEVRIVGIEGGEHEAFADAPYYDERAMQQERVIIAAFSTASEENLPRGVTRVATIHVQVRGGVTPVFEARLEAAATVGGEEIEANVVHRQGTDT